MAAPGRVTVRTFDVSETAAAARARRRSTGARAARPARHPPQPVARRDVPGAAARAASRRGARAAAHHVPVRLRRSRSCARRAPRSAQAAETLRAARHRRPDVPIGVMIEVPSAALTADLLAARGGLLQHRHQRSDPVLRWPSIAPTTACRACTSRCTRRSCACCGMVARAGAARAACRSSVCGEMAADPVLLTLLVGLGPARVQHGAGARFRWPSRWCAACAPPTPRRRRRPRAARARRPRKSSSVLARARCAALSDQTTQTSRRRPS